jgi:hypothetical protein
LAFSLVIPLPTEEGNSPGNTVTDSLTLQTQVQPIAATVRAQIFGHLRPRASQKGTQAGRVMVAANAPLSSSDVNYLAAATSDSSAAGSRIGGGNSESVWISTAINSLENDFSRTAFYGATQNLLVGFDLTRSSKYVAGLSVGFEGSNFTTTFNAGNEKTRGFNVNPYFAWLISDTWSVDLILGYGDFNTNQTRTVGSPVLGTLPVNSEFSSKRGLASSNLTNVSTFGNWKLTGSLGFLWSRRENDAYVETVMGDAFNAVPESKQTLEQWNLLGEAAYGRGNSEAFFGALYESTHDIQKVTFSSGEQPANDPTSVLLTAGWRYFATRGLSANFVFSARVSQNDFKEQYGFSMLLRMDL